MQEKIFLHIGIDSTDSPRMGCTTYVCANVVEELIKKEAEFIDYPNLIRLNPNIPWKTRGNAATCVRIRIRKEKLEEIKEETIKTVKKLSDLTHKKASPGIVFYTGEKIPRILRQYAKKTIREVVTMKKAEKVIDKIKAEAIKIKEGLGIIGALAAIGETLNQDHTYELITYRVKQNWGKPRKIDQESVLKMDQETKPSTFNNVDYETGRILITPRGPDPILYGIRGENPQILLKAMKIVKIYEPIERWIIYRTNQGTDAHFKKITRIKQVKPYHSIILKAKVTNKPITIKGGHVIFKITDEEKEIDCAVYEPTAPLTKIARQLIEGDLVEVYGSVKPTIKAKLTINVEKLAILKLTPLIKQKNPRCPKCGKTLKKQGRDKGYKCIRCGYKTREKLPKRIQVIPRKILEGTYLPPPKAHRHLTKPTIRIGQEKRHPPQKIITPWYWSTKLKI